MLAVMVAFFPTRGQGAMAVFFRTPARAAMEAFFRIQALGVEGLAPRSS